MKPPTPMHYLPNPNLDSIHTILLIDIICSLSLHLNLTKLWEQLGASITFNTFPKTLHKIAPQNSVIIDF